MPAPPSAPDALAAFIARWAASSVSERSNCQPFLTELCDLLDVPRPDPAQADTTHNAYVFERAVPLHQRDGKTTTGHIDLYRRGAFVLEAKQYAERKAESDTLELGALMPGTAKPRAGLLRGSEAWDDAMLKARGQAERYARNLPEGEPTPPFLLVVDVGHVFELYADFSQQGKAYLPFPDARANRIRLADLRDATVRTKLRAIWLEPLTLDPSKISAAVTREVARYLAELAKLFEKKHDPAIVAAFLSRCLFCMFAEDIDLLPRDSFTHLLESLKNDPGAAVPALEDLFSSMNDGRFYSRLMKRLLRFNGGLFAESRALPLDGTSLGLLIDAAKKDWKHVEPAIFGTLLERALVPSERHKLGAHYTPRAYVERLVLPTVVEPLREEWELVRAAAVTLAGRGDLKAAIKETRAFHHRLCAVRVLDPACGSGNFLYVALEHLKRLEGEVLQLIEAFGENMRLDLGGETVDPHQFLGLEINPRAATIAELVLWIGYLQWHHRNRGATEWPEPVLRAFKNIECRDAVLAYDGKPEPITWQMAYANRKLPGLPQGGIGLYSDEKHGFICETRTNSNDEPYSCPIFAYEKPRAAEWPVADFIVGNPPFIGNKWMRDDLGGGYVETLRNIFPAELDGADFVMFWWHKAATLTREGKCRRFGFITTNSIRQTSNRRVMQAHLGPILEGDAPPLLSLRMAIPDHPWVEGADGAAVRIAMTVAGVKKLDRPGELSVVTDEATGDNGEVAIKLATTTGSIHPDLTVGADIGLMPAMLANKGLSFMGVSLIGQGFLVSEVPKTEKRFVRPFIIGRDLNQLPEPKQVVDFFGLSAEDARERAPALYDQLLRTVKPERDTNNRAGYRDKWWLYGEQRTGLRNATAGLARYVVTCRTAKHRLFMFVSGETIVESTIIGIPSDDAFHLGALSSRIHVVYSLAAGGRLGVGNDPRYNNSLCFDPFPFPDCTEKQKGKIRALAEELDAHRKRAQAQHGIGLTDLYNVLEKIRAASASSASSGDATPSSRLANHGDGGVAAPVLTAKEKLLHDQALVSTLRQLHDDLDASVAAAYGWPWPLPDAEILARVVALNAARAAEEAKGIVRWLRPDYQKPLFAGETQSALGLEDSEPVGAGLPRDASRRSAVAKAMADKKAAAKKKTPWPAALSDRVRAVELALAAEEKPATAADLAKRYARAKPADLAEILQTLVTLGRARPGDATGTFVR